jgi:hypothetical protein
MATLWVTSLYGGVFVSSDVGAELGDVWGQQNVFDDDWLMDIDGLDKWSVYVAGLSGWNWRTCKGPSHWY